VQDVSLKFGETQVLRNINFEIKDIVRPNMTQGQIVGILAPSGMGKSQLLKIMAGVQKPTTGQIFVGEQQLPVEVGQVGFVQQNYPLFNHRTLYSNMDRAASKKIIDKVERKDKISSLLDKFDLTKVMNSYPVQLSGGQRQRAAIVQQVLCSSDFVLLDEVTSGLDYNMKNKTMDVIAEVSCLTDFTSIIIVSHDIESTVRVADTIYILGRELDAENKHIPGAIIRYQIDLIERDLAWHKDIDKTLQFTNTVNEIKSVFPTL
jgi:polar amino acid transport system ATP-binding protein/sulfate transport system ATP-binding protein